MRVHTANLGLASVGAAGATNVSLIFLEHEDVLGNYDGLLCGAVNSIEHPDITQLVTSCKV